MQQTDGFFSLLKEYSSLTTPFIAVACDKKTTETCATNDWGCGKFTKTDKKTILGEVRKFSLLSSTYSLQGCLADANGALWNLNGCQKFNMFGQDGIICGCMG